MSSIMSSYYKIIINDIPMDTQRYELLESIYFEDCDNGSDLVTLVFNDPDQFIIEDDFVIEDTKIYIKGGYSADDCFEFTGYITVIDANFPEDGSPSVTVHCLDGSYIMDKDTVKKTWEKTTHSEIARTIFESHGFKAVVDDTSEVKDSESQNGTDLDFLVSLASKEVDDYICYVENDTGYYVKKKLLDEYEYQLDYKWGNGQLLSFSPRINKKTKTIASDENVNLNTKGVDKATSSVSEKQTSGVNTNTNNSNKSSSDTWSYNNGKWEKNN